MSLDRNRLYSLLFVACLAGYIWLYYNIRNGLSESQSVDVCLIKHVTGIPCPSCGSTRSVISLANGEFAQAFGFNPFGYLIAVIMVIAPLWMAADKIMGRSSLYDWYQKIEIRLKRPMFAIPLILLVLINWFWNISKGL